MYIRARFMSFPLVSWRSVSMKCLIKKYSIGLVSMRFFLFNIFIWFCFTLHTAQAQLQKEIDSLYKVLNAQPAADGATKIRIYSGLSWLYATTRSETPTARLYADTVLQLATSLKDKKSEALAYFYYGVIDRFEGNFRSGEKNLKTYIRYNQKSGDSARVAMGLFQLGTVYLGMDEFDQGLKVLYRALAIHEAASDYSNTNVVLNAIGYVFKNSGRHDEAIEIFERVLSTDSLDSDVLMNLGNIYGDQRHTEKALHYYYKALHVDKMAEARWAIAYDLEAIGLTFSTLKLYDSALYYYRQSLSIREQLSDRKEKAISLSQVGMTLAHLNDFRKSEEFLIQALSIASEVDSRSLKRDIYEKLALVKDLQNDMPGAYAYYKQYTALKDSLLTAESLKELNELKTRYETDKKDQQIELLSKENEINLKEAQRLATVKNAFVTGIILLALFAVLVVYTLNQRLKNQKLIAQKDNQLKETNFKSQLNELKMKALQAQINPHFIFNCLNSINELILEGDKEKASLYLFKFSRLIRLILENSEGAEVSLQDEMMMLQAYIELEELRFNGKIAYTFHINENINSENTFLPSMILQPFVENAIWYGLKPKGGNVTGHIKISLKEMDEQLFCVIEDDGIGREKAKELQQKSVWKTKSMGIRITEERLQLISNELKRQFIQITDMKDEFGNALGTRVEINIPMN